MASHEHPVFIVTFRDIQRTCEERGEPMLSEGELRGLESVVGEFLDSWLAEAIHELRHDMVV
jgi:hypothetical protein